MLSFGKVSHNGHHEIIEGDEPLQASKFIDDESDVVFGFSELFNEFSGGHAGWDVEGRGGKGFEFDLAGKGEVGPERLDADETKYIVSIFRVDGKVGMSASGDGAPVLVVGVCGA